MSDVLNISSLSVGNEIDSEPFLVDGANTRKVVSFRQGCVKK